MNSDFDILITGAGMVGASLACALRHVPLRIGVVEAVAPDAPDQPSFDARAIALAQGSKRIFDALGVWQPMAEAGATAIRRIHVSDRGHFGMARIDAASQGVEALGYVAEAGAIGKALTHALHTLPNTELICPARVVGLQVQPERVVATLDEAGQSRQVTARLLVAADGGRSAARDLLGARTLALGYGQTAVIATVTTDREHGYTAYERFTDSGPLALLPCDASGGERGRRWSLVWTLRDAQVDEWLALDDNAFLQRLQSRFGHRAGRFLQAGPRSAYPLGLNYVRDHVRERVAFIGNAAHTIHPVGGQGFNLGLRDVATLAEVLADAARMNRDPGTMATLQAYAEWRRSDYLKVMTLTDGLARVFSTGFGPLAAARNLGLLGLELFGPVKRLFARQTMGLVGRLPRLARGLPLQDPAARGAPPQQTEWLKKRAEERVA